MKRSAQKPDDRQRVLITINHGDVEVFYNEANVMVEIVDCDEYRANGSDANVYLDHLVEKYHFPYPRSQIMRTNRKVSSFHRTILDPEHTLFQLRTLDAQIVAVKEQKRELNAAELLLVREHYSSQLDLHQVLALCIRRSLD